MRMLTELGIDLSQRYSKSVEDLAGQPFDLVVIVCDRPCSPETAR